MTVKIPNWLLFSILVATGILIFALIRGCNNSNNLQLSNINYKEEIKRHKEDSIKNAQDKIAYNDSMEFIEGQWALSKNKEIALNENLSNANERINRLLSKHVPIEPNPDSSMTWAPNEFITECSECFHELKYGQQLVLKYKAEKENQEHICLGKLNLKDNRIASLEKSNIKLGASNASLLSNLKEIEDKWKPRSRLYLSWGVLWSPWPVGAGGGLMYQTKRNMIMGLKGYYGIPRGEKNARTTVETTINFPLSFKRR